MHRLSLPLFALLLAAACADDEARPAGPLDGFDAGSDLPIGVVIADRDAKPAARPESDASVRVEPPDAARPDAAYDAATELDAELAAPDARAPELDASTVNDARALPVDATGARDAARSDGCVGDCTPADAAVDACSEPSGPTLFEEHFEQDSFMNGEYHGFLLRDPSARVSIDPGTAARPARSLRITRPLAEADAGASVLSLERALASLVPRYISYRVKVAALDPSGSIHVQIGGAPPAAAVAVLTIADDELRVADSNVRWPFEADSWLLVELRDIDWAAHRYDLHVDCRRVARDLPFDDSVDSLDRLGFVNDGATSYYDDIVIK